MENKIRLSGTIKESIVDGPGIRYVIFTQGCRKRCPGCHNPETQPLNGGYLEDMDNLVEEWRKNPLIRGITISGGEPFLQPDKILYLVNKAKETGLTVIIYSGYYIEELKKRENPIIDEILDKSDFLVDGPFILSKASRMLLFRGSSNQRIIDLQKSKKLNGLVAVEDFGF